MKRLEEHEAFEMRALRWLASKRFLGHLVMGGGTMLRLCHDLPRYSIDMDFWFYREMESDAFYKRLSEAMKQEWDVTDAWNKHYSILLEVRRAKGAPRLKIEVRKEVAYRGSSEQKIAFSPHFPEQVLVRGFTLKQMLSGLFYKYTNVLFLATNVILWHGGNRGGCPCRAKARTI